MKTRMLAIIILAASAGVLPAGAQTPSSTTRESSGMEAAVLTQAPEVRGRSSRSIITLRRVRPLPELLPQAEVTVHRTPSYRRHDLILGRLRNEQVQISCFRRKDLQPLPGERLLGVRLRGKTQYGMQLSLTW